VSWMVNLAFAHSPSSPIIQLCLLVMVFFL
jgi:hypothetical protein